MKLFMFYVGGDCGDSNVELHDVRFSIGEAPEACHDDLRRQWWGDAKSLHIDCWGEVRQADGYDIGLTTAPPPEGPGRLFFVNLGGYDRAQFTELHRNVLLVAADETAAKAKALSAVGGWSEPHKDNVLDVEKALDVTTLLRRYGYFLSLTPAAREEPFVFTCKYLPIGSR